MKKEQKQYKAGCMSKVEVIAGIYKLLEQGAHPITCLEAIHLIKCQDASLRNFIDVVEIAKNQIKE